MDENINYKKGKLNFTNYAYNKNNGLFLFKIKMLHLELIKDIKSLSKDIRPNKKLKIIK